MEAEKLTWWNKKMAFDAPNATTWIAVIGTILTLGLILFLVLILTKTIKFGRYTVNDHSSKSRQVQDASNEKDHMMMIAKMALSLAEKQKELDHKIARGRHVTFVDDMINKPDDHDASACGNPETPEDIIAIYD